MFHIGDKIVHPLHGAGEITQIVERTIDGETMQYYALKLRLENVVLYLPVSKCDTLGIRPVLSPSEAQQLLEQLRTVECVEEKGWNQRYRENMMRIRSGNLLEVAQVLKSLSARNGRRGLSTGEKKVMTSARQILVSEIACALDLEPKEAEQRIWEIMKDEG